MENKGWQRGKLAAIALCLTFGVGCLALALFSSFSSLSCPPSLFIVPLDIGDRKHCFPTYDDALAFARGSQRRRSDKVRWNISSLTLFQVESADDSTVIIPRPSKMEKRRTVHIAAAV